MEKKTYNFTTIEQGKYLEKIGVKRKTADCSHRPYAYTDHYHYYESQPKWEGPVDKDDIPCWTAEALMKLMPTGSHLEKKTDGYECYAVFTKPVSGDTPVEACYNAICELIESECLSTLKQ